MTEFRPSALFKRLFALLTAHDACFLSGAFVFETDALFDILVAFGKHASRNNDVRVAFAKRFGQGKYIRARAKTHNFHMYDDVFQKQRLGKILKDKTRPAVRIVESSPQYELAYARAFVRCPCDAMCDAPKKVILFYRFRTSENKTYTFVKLESSSTILMQNRVVHGIHAFQHYFAGKIKDAQGYPVRREDILTVTPAQAADHVVACDEPSRRCANQRTKNFKLKKNVVAKHMNLVPLGSGSSGCCLKLTRAMLYPNEAQDKRFYSSVVGDARALARYNRTLRTRNEFFVSAKVLLALL